MGEGYKQNQAQKRNKEKSALFNILLGRLSCHLKRVPKMGIFNKSTGAQNGTTMNNSQQRTEDNTGFNYTREQSQGKQKQV